MNELAALGIRLIVVTGDLIEGTITPKLLERTAQEMGQVIADATVDASLPSGHIIVIGAPLASLLAPASE